MGDSVLKRRLSVGCMLRELMTDIGDDNIKGTQNYCHKSITLHSNNLVRPSWPALGCLSVASVSTAAALIFRRD